MSAKWTKPFADNDYRRTLAIAHTAWWSTVVVVALRAFDILPQSLGLIALLTMGGGVAASLALSRMRLSQTISQVFTVGLQSAIGLSANVFTDTCIMAVDGEGKIESVDHADAIGWDEIGIQGHELRALLAPRSHGLRVIRPGTSMTSPMVNQKGEQFDARLSFAALKLDSEGKESETMIVTVSPVVAINSEGNYKRV